MLQTPEINTYLLSLSAKVFDEAFAEQISSDFRTLTGPDAANFSTTLTGSTGEPLEIAAIKELAPAVSMPVVYTVIHGPMVWIVDPAICGSSLNAAGVLPNFEALGMHIDSGGLPAPDYSSLKQGQNSQDDSSGSSESLGSEERMQFRNYSAVMALAA